MEKTITFEEVKVCAHCNALSEERFIGDEGWSFCTEECGCIDNPIALQIWKCP